jgi:hypothetical protein
MEQSPSREANNYSRSASQEIPHVLWNLKVYYRLHKNPQLVPYFGSDESNHILKPNFKTILILS